MVIYRMPRHISIVLPSSHCPECKTPLPWYLNIPLLSFILLRGKCRFCGKRISFRYPLVELATALSFLFLFRKFGFTSSFVIYLILVLDLILVTFIDWEHLYIPDLFTLGLLPVGWLTSFYNPVFSNTPLLSSFLGAVTGFISLLIIGLFGKVLFRKEAMGGGDLKLLAGIGSFLGIKGVFFTIFLSSLLGSFIGILLILFKIKKKGDYIPYGPFLSIGAVIFLFSREILERLFF